MNQSDPLPSRGHQPRSFSTRDSRCRVVRKRENRSFVAPDIFASLQNLLVAEMTTIEKTQRNTPALEQRPLLRIDIYTAGCHYEVRLSMM